MADSQMNVKGNSTTSTMGQILWRLVTSAVVLAITAFFTPGFSINNLWTLAIAAIVLSIMDYIITKFTGLHASSFGRGIVGFALAVATLYATQFFVAGYTIIFIAKRARDYPCSFCILIYFFYYLVFVFVYRVFWNYSSY